MMATIIIQDRGLVGPNQLNMMGDRAMIGTELAAMAKGIEPAPQADMLTAVLLGAVLSAMVTLPLALPLQASVHDLSLLAVLGVFQLAIPCLMAVTAARTLKAPEAALLSLLEVIFGVAWAWLGAGESPSLAVLGGGALVLGALALNEAVALRERTAGALPPVAS